MTSGNLAPVPPPKPWPNANKRLVLGQGVRIDPIRLLEIFSDKEFELFVTQWAHEYLTTQYDDVLRWAGPGDKGRDVVGWIDPPSANPRRWDNYQCKHYKDPLAPSDVWPEIGKLCFFTFCGDLLWPEQYYFVSHKGAGPTLNGLVAAPDRLRDELLKEWDKSCKNAIRKDPVPLTDELTSFILSLDFSRIRILQPQLLLEQHSKTKYHAFVFGTQLKPRPSPSSAPPTIQATEMRYVQRLMEAFQDHLKRPISSLADTPPHLREAFNHARTCFYSTEALKEFARDTCHDDEYYSDLVEQFHQGILPAVLANHPDGYARLGKAIEHALALQLAANALREEVLPNDRTGFCHHLANLDRVSWVRP